MKNLSKQFTFAISAALMVSSLALAHGKKDQTDATDSLKSVTHATITFSDGSSLLSDPDRATLHDLIINAKAVGNTVDQITIAAWSDKELPKKDHALLDTDRELAKSRAQNISDYMRTVLDITPTITTYNMAENSNWLAKTYRKAKGELKSVFSKKNAASPVTDADFKVIRHEGGPNQAVVLIERETK